MKYDVAVIGGGVVGALISRELSITDMLSRRHLKEDFQTDPVF